MRRPFTTLSLVLISLPWTPSLLRAETPCAIQELVVGEAIGLPGDRVDVELLGGVSCEVTGFSIAIGHDPTRLSFLDATAGQFLLDHAGSDLLFHIGDHDPDGYAALGAIFDISFPLTVPPTVIESGTVLATLSYEILPGAPPGVAPLLNRSGVYGEIPIRNIYSGVPGSAPIEPRLVDGAVTIGGSRAVFRRGDVNTDGGLDISDAVLILLHLFHPPTRHPLPCQKSADVDDTGGVDLTDAIFLLSFLFRAASPPPTPYPECGTDLTRDGLTCDSFPICDVP